MYNVITERDGTTVHIICGPVQKKEIPKWYRPAQMNTDPGEEVKAIDYPDVAMLIDCDCYNDKPDPKVAEIFFKSGLRLSTSIAAQLKNLILEK